MTTDALWAQAIGTILIVNAVLILNDMDRKTQSLFEYFLRVFLASLYLSLAILILARLVT